MGSTLWHEMNHVFVLTATQHRAPRWFAEGLAVHEEGQASPAWGERLTPDIVVALKGKKLLPVAQLDRGFIHPEYPEQILVSYYQAGHICDYIQSRGGREAGGSRACVRPLTPTPDVIKQTLGLRPRSSTEQFQAVAVQKTLERSSPASTSGALA